MILIMTPFFHLLTNNHCQGDFLANCTSNPVQLHIFIESIWKVGYKQLCRSLTRLLSFGVNQNLTARSLKIYVSPPS